MVPIDLVGAAEISEMLGITKQRVNQIATQDPTFPEPAASLTAGRIWKRADIEKWARKTGRLRSP